MMAISRKAWRDKPGLAGLGGFVNTYTQTFNVTSRTSGFVNGATNGRNWAYNNYAAFVQDQWKVAPRLTLTLGLRYDYFSPVDETNGLVLMPVVQGSVVNTLMSNATLNFAGGDSGRPLYNKDLNNFAPTVAFAWDVFGNGKTAVRGGYSINYVDDNNIATATHIARLVSYQAMIETTSDIDIYKFTVTSSFKVVLTNLPETYGVELYDHTGVLIIYSNTHRPFISSFFEKWQRL